MADDARISTALPRHPKTVKLARRLQEKGLWALICLFLWVAENKPAGDLTGLSSEDIEIGAGWKGKAGVFVAALVEVGFLDGEESAYFVHDWAVHNPWAEGRARRVAAAKAAAQSRWGSALGTNARRMRTACKQQCGFDAPNPTQPNPTRPNQKPGAK